MVTEIDYSNHSSAARSIANGTVEEPILHGIKKSTSPPRIKSAQSSKADETENDASHYSVVEIVHKCCTVGKAATVNGEAPSK